MPYVPQGATRGQVGPPRPTTVSPQLARWFTSLTQPARQPSVEESLNRIGTGIGGPQAQTGVTGPSPEEQEMWAKISQMRQMLQGLSSRVQQSSPTNNQAFMDWYQSIMAKQQGSGQAGGMPGRQGNAPAQGAPLDLTDPRRLQGWGMG